MSPETFQAAILDMDGVITQTAKVHARAWKRLFDDYLKQREARDGQTQQLFDVEADYRPYVDGKPRFEGVRSFLESRGISLPQGDPADDPSEETIYGLGNRKNQIFHELLQQEGVEAFEDAVEQMDAWKRAGWKIAVISSSRNCEEVLKAANLLERFDAKVDGNDLGPLQLKGKPAPDMFLQAARQLGIEPSRAIVVEDAIAGVRAARAGRFGLVVGIGRDHEGDDLREAGADVVIRDLRELQDLARSSTERDHAGDASPLPALENMDEIAERLKGRKLALFLDYDGTLTPIVKRPEDATLSDAMRSLLVRLAHQCTVAIVSGRDRRNAEEMVAVENLVYASSHGFDIRGPEGLAMQHEEAKRLLPELDEAERLLCKEIANIRGARVERKKFAIAVHYREVAGEEDAKRVERAVDEACRQHSGLRKKGGKKIFEVQPDVEWDKGRAVLWLVESLGLDKPGIVVMYIGDDVTDEDAFRALENHEDGIGIRVATPDSDAAATFVLADCDEVQEFLQSLSAMLDESQGDK